MTKPKMFVNSYYLRCIDLATKSKGTERYGSILVSGEKIIGEGFNRAIAHPSFGKLERHIKQGMANHAEVEAVNDALLYGRDTSGADLYVAGYFPVSGQLFFQNEYTCARCIPHLRDSGIKNFYVPMPGGWIKKSPDAAKMEAKKFTNGTHKKRLEIAIGNYSINELVRPVFP